MQWSSAWWKKLFGADSCFRILDNEGIVRVGVLGVLSKYLHHGVMDLDNLAGDFEGGSEVRGEHLEELGLLGRAEGVAGVLLVRRRNHEPAEV
jgi:hypothetical protein